MYIVKPRKGQMRKTKEEAQKTREDILNAAVSLFSQKGVQKTTLEEIARAANVTRGAIYWHFKNKIEIFEALHERLHRPLIEMVLEDIGKDHPEPLIQLEELCIELLLDVAHNEQKRQALTLFLIKCDYAGELAPYKKKHLEKKAETMKLFRGYFDKAKKMGKIPADADTEILTLAYHCFIKGILFERLNNPDNFDMQKKAPELVRLFFQKL